MAREEMKTTLTLGDIGTITIPKKKEVQQWLYSLIESFVWRKDYPYSKTQILKYIAEL